MRCGIEINIHHVVEREKIGAARMYEVATRGSDTVSCWWRQSTKLVIKGRDSDTLMPVRDR